MRTHAKTVCEMSGGASPVRTISCLAVYLVVAAQLCLPLASHAQTAGPATTQRQINALIAPLWSLHRIMIEEPGLRAADEPLEAYCERLAMPLPSENRAAYCARIERYLAAAKQAASAATNLTTVPPLQDREAENRRLWAQAARQAGCYAARTERLKRAWRERMAEGASAAAAGRKLGSEMAQTLLLVKAIVDPLRDARP